MTTNNVSRALAELKSTAGSMRLMVTVACAALLILFITAIMLMP